MSHTSRRGFLKATSQTAFVLALGFSTDSKAKHLVNLNLLGFDINPYITINEDGKVTLFNPRPDMGQGTYQALPLLIAEELEIDLDQVEIQMTDGSAKFGSQTAEGSSSVNTRWIPLRTAGATVREMLVQAAANRWSLPTSDCYALKGRVYQKNGSTSLSYGELVEAASKLPAPTKPTLKSFKDFTQLGKKTARPDVPMKVNGTAIFGMDVQLPGMYYAAMLHAPTIYGKLTGFKGEKAMAVRGVRFVLKTERIFYHGPFNNDLQKSRSKADAIAIVAESYHAAMKGKKLVEATWASTGFAESATSQYFNQTKAAAQSPGSPYPQDAVGNFDEAFAGADQKLQATYQTPFMAHAAMEPCNATVYVQADKVEVWAPVQGPDSLVGELAKYLGYKPEQIKINVTFLGGAFGRKAYYDYVLEAAHISRQVGAPVKMIWSREDDIQQGPFRPGMVSAMQGGLDANGQVIAFEHRLNGASIMSSVFKADMAGKVDPWAGEGISLADSPYQFKTRRNSFSWVDPQMPVLWWRSVYASTNLFGQESFIDELAHAADQDPLDFRLNLLKDQPRFVAVLTKLAQISDYTSKRKTGKFIGIAVARCFGSIVAHAMEVKKLANSYAIEHIYSVIDCGFALNPDNVIAQVESNIAYGLSATIKNEITRSHGVTEQSNFHDYAVLRQGEFPASTVSIIENQEDPGGVGEPGLPAIAPALANALFLASGKRLRSLPFDLSSL